ncbi:MAG: transposase [Magnetococcus sp. DMHC-6]
MISRPINGIQHLGGNFEALDAALERLKRKKSELLMVLECPETPLHTNGSENDIRVYVTKRKISGGTRSEEGKECRDAFLSLMKTCAKLSISFWDYLGCRLGVPNTDHPTTP